MWRTAQFFGVGEQTVANSVDMFAAAVVRHYAHLEIKLPSAAEAFQCALDIYENRGMPACVGALDGKHFPIKAGFVDDSSYKCYKGFRSVNVLALVDHRYCFIWKSDPYPGAASDAKIWNLSNLKVLMASGSFHISDLLHVSQSASMWFVSSKYVFVEKIVKRIHKVLYHYCSFRIWITLCNLYLLFFFLLSIFFHVS